MWTMLGKYEVYLWMVAMALLGILSVHNAGERLYNDSYQYLSVADNLRTRGQIATSIVYFDIERARGQLPASMTTFPPGYSVAINSLLWTGCSPETAAWLISLFSMVVVVPLLWWGATLLGATTGMRRLAIAGWVLNSEVIGYSSTALSEGLFTAIVLAAVVLLIFSECSSHQPATRLSVPAAMALIGFSYWVRYAAILVVAGLVIYIGWLAIERKSRLWTWLSSLPICLGFIACGMVRNWQISGTWRGGNDLPVHHPFFGVLQTSIGVCYHLVFGSASYHLLFANGRATLSLFAVALSVSAILAVAVILFTSAKTTDNRLLLSPPTSLLFIVVVGYGAGMIYLGTHTVISFSARMFVPIFPELILLCTVVVTHFWPATSKLGSYRAIPLLATVAMCGYSFQNMYDLSLFSETYIAHNVELAAFFAEPTHDGVPLSLWLDKEISVDSPVLATDGQATAYVIHRPTICTIERAFSSQEWDENEVRRTMLTYQAKYLITYPGLSVPNAPEQEESRFLHDLTEGKHPWWLEPTARNTHVAIFEMSSTLR